MLQSTNAYLDAEPFYFCAGNNFYATSTDTAIWTEVEFTGNIQQLMYQNDNRYMAVENDGVYLNDQKIIDLPQNYTDASWPFFMFVGGVVNVLTQEITTYEGAVYGPNHARVEQNVAMTNNGWLVDGEDEELVMLGATDKYVAISVNGDVLFSRPDHFITSYLLDVIDMSGELVASSDGIYTITGDLVRACEPTYVFSL